jgi:hypothetical protein
MDSLQNSVSENSGALVKAFISIGLLKGADYAGRWIGNIMRNKINSRMKRYMIYLIMVVALLIASNIYYRRDYEPNLFRKYGLTRFTSPEKIRELYRSLARQSHPDMRGRRSDFVDVNTELKALMNDKQRWFYDRFGHLSVEASPSEEQTEQITFAMGTLMEYLGKAMFVVVFVQNDLNLNTRMSALGLVLVFLLFDIYNITARRSTAKDPLDFVYYDFTIAERSEILKTTFNLFFFFLITYKFAFEEPWVVSWLKWVSHTEVLQIAMAHRSTVARPHLQDQHIQLTAHRTEVVRCMQLLVSKKKPKQSVQTLEQIHANDTGANRGTFPDNDKPDLSARSPEGDRLNEDLRRGRIFTPPTDNDQTDILIEQIEEEEVQDPRDTSLWSMVWSFVKGIATFYAFNMLIQFLLNL